jgi:hypothetical protein
MTMELGGREHTEICSVPAPYTNVEVGTKNLKKKSWETKTHTWAEASYKREICVFLRIFSNLL